MTNIRMFAIFCAFEALLTTIASAQNRHPKIVPGQARRSRHQSSATRSTSSCARICLTARTQTTCERIGARPTRPVVKHAFGKFSLPGGQAGTFHRRSCRF